MKNLNKTARIAAGIITLGIALLTFSCDMIPENKIDLRLTDEMASQSYSQLLNQGRAVYDYIPKGYNSLDGAMMAAATDEAAHAIPGSNIEKYQSGLWGPADNPDNAWKEMYRGIRFANLYLHNSNGYQDIILRDTSTQAGKAQYLQQCNNLEWMRNEARVLRAYYYFELIKRYGGVPVVDKIYGPDDVIDLPRKSYEQVVQFILEELDAALPNLQENWMAQEQASFGRVNKGTAMAIKSRVLLYYASPLNNPSHAKNRWELAADAAKNVIDDDNYALANYATMFTGANGHQNTEVIFCHMTGNNNTPERYNYPITTNGGASGTCPSANLVDAYENSDGSVFDWSQVGADGNPYEGRDPRLNMTVVVNNSQWNGRAMQCYAGGYDATGIQTTTTGYYLKKFLTDGLDLELNRTAVHSWPLFRYGEILLNYAEAMNEAYGPDADPYGDGKTARWAVNEVRGRTGVEMPPVTAAGEVEMRERIKHERRIELAFENHRFWDVRRWGETDAKAALNVPIRGVVIQLAGDIFTYSSKTVENRVFETKMLLYPIPQSEMLKSGGELEQNKDW